MDEPNSSYSLLDIQMSWKLPNDARIDPPIHAFKALSLLPDDMDFTLQPGAVLCTILSTSDRILSGNPWKFDPPPEKIMLENSND
jgi:hypothetical protein